MLRPLFTYAGSKTKLVPLYFEAENYPKFRHVHEAFGGSNAFSIYCLNENVCKKVFTKELSFEITNIYIALRVRQEVFIKKYLALLQLWNSKSEKKRSELYFYVRDEVYRKEFKKEGEDILYRIICFLFLMKTKFNGLFILKNNVFNTACGNLNKTFSIEKEKENLLEFVKELNTRLIISQENFFKYEEKRYTKNSSNVEDLYFLDPPYQTSIINYGDKFKDEEHKHIFEFTKKKLIQMPNATIWIAHLKNEYYLNKIEELKNDFEIRIHYFNYKHTRKKINDVVEMLIVIKNKKEKRLNTF